MAQQKGSPNDNQKDSLAALLAVLEGVYAADAPEVVADASNVELEADRGDSEEDLA